MQYEAADIITVQEARKLLGSDGKELSDDQIRDLVDTLSLMASTHLINLGSNISDGKS